MMRWRIEKARRQGVRIEIAILDRAFFIAECVNLLNDLG
jgi:hypothetical protein